VNLERPAVVRGLMAASALVFVIALIGAFTVDANDTKLASGGGTTSTTSTVETVPGVTPTVATTAAPTATTSKATVTTKAAAGPPPTASTAVPDPGATKAPAPGNYDYAVNESGQSPRTMTEKIEAKPDENGAARRVDTYTDADGNTLTNDERWASDSIKVLSSHIVSPQATIDCTWNPPILEAALPLSVGKTWTSDSTCKTSYQGAQITVHQVSQAKVTGKSLDKVGGTSIATWIIESTDTTDVTSPFGTQHGTETAVRHFAPPKGLLTYEKTTGTTTAGSSITSERTLQNLSPK
jgi:hypothetical protein